MIISSCTRRNMALTLTEAIRLQVPCLHSCWKLSRRLNRHPIGARRQRRIRLNSARERGFGAPGFVVFNILGTTVKHILHIEMLLWMPWLALYQGTTLVGP